MLESTTTSTDGYRTVSRIQGSELAIDARTEDDPSPTDTLLASYASCYTVALRIGARQRDIDGLGRIEIDTEADRDDENDLEAVRFTVTVETDAPDETLRAVVDRANDLCHVHDAIREELRADVSIHGDGF
ncbi:OsmC family protein (plasmid) [Haladaptatus sp. SPP-AMP-3]|uniref:OsmC family protein n=1 Tax=Haladaptatus sp. SPP-AMP-3 TaxID=3121295 RepID=UPI003C2CA9D8